MSLADQVASLEKENRVLRQALSLPEHPNRQPFVSVQIGMVWGQAVVNGTRLKVETVVESYQASGEQYTCKTWDITRADLLVCCWFASQYETGYRRRWKAWAGRVYESLAAGEWETAGLPPRTEPNAEKSPRPRRTEGNSSTADRGEERSGGAEGRSGEGSVEP